MKKKKDTQLAFSVIPDGEQGTVLSTALDLSTLEAHLWEAANILRGPVDAADFKTYIFPLLFFKRISDVYDEEIAAALAESGGDQEFASFPENHRFQIPDDCHWRDVRNVVKTSASRCKQPCARSRRLTPNNFTASLAMRSGPTKKASRMPHCATWWNTSPRSSSLSLTCLKTNWDRHTNISSKSLPTIVGTPPPSFIPTVPSFT